MTAFQAIALTWAAGIALFAVIKLRDSRNLLSRDPLMLCDQCREHRRDLAMMVGAGPALYALALIFETALWPFTAPVDYGRFAWDLARFRLVPGAPSPWCDCDARSGSDDRFAAPPSADTPDSPAHPNQETSPHD